MRIQSFAVNNFRGIKGGLDQNRIKFDDKNAIFIFGQNNVGKSTFLHAYEAFYNDTVIDGKDFPFGEGADIEMELVLHVDEALEKDSINEGAPGKYDNLKDKYLDTDNTLRLRKTWKNSDKKKSFNQTYNSQEGVWEDTANGGIGFHNVIQPFIMKPLFISAMPSEEDVQKVVNEVLKEVATSKLTRTKIAELDEALSKVSRLQDEMYKKDDIDAYKKDVNARFGELFDGFTIDVDEGTSRAKFTHDKIGKDFKVSFVDKSSQNNTHEQMGHGAIRMAIFLLMLMRDKLQGIEAKEKSFLVLFEEPELFLHPVLTKKLRKLVYDVSEKGTPFQILCASHSPQMIDISRDHMSLVRMTKNETDGSTRLFQVEREDLKNNEQATSEDIKQKIYEILRLDPYVCEAFYADEVLLVEGDTEAVLARGYQQSIGDLKDVFVVNCHSVVNIPFYQKLFAKFNIPYSVICDTDHIQYDKSDRSKTVSSNRTQWNKETGDRKTPEFGAYVQKTISDLYMEHKKDGLAMRFFVFPETFEPCHENLGDDLGFDPSGDNGKPFNANRYWIQLQQHKDKTGYDNVPVIKYFNAILRNEAVS